MWFGFTIVYHGDGARRAVGDAAHVPVDERLGLPPDGVSLRAVDGRGHALHNTFFFTVGEVPRVRFATARFDRFLVRPLDTLFQVTRRCRSRSSPTSCSWRSSTGCRGSRRPAVVRIDWLFVIFVPLVVVGGALIDLGITLAICDGVRSGSFAVDTLRWVVMSLEQDFTRYPISIYARGVRLRARVRSAVRVHELLSGDVLACTRADTGLHLNPAIGLLTPVIGLAWLCVSYGLWRLGCSTIKARAREARRVSRRCRRGASYRPGARVYVGCRPRARDRAGHARTHRHLRPHDGAGAAARLLRIVGSLSDRLDHQSAHYGHGLRQGRSGARERSRTRSRTIRASSSAVPIL